MFITQDELKSKLVGILKLEGLSLLAPYWDEITEDAVNTSYYDLLGALMARGYSMPQVNLWAAGPAFQKDQAIFWCLIKAAGLTTTQGAFDDKFVNRFDRREDLKTAVVMDDSGNLLIPAGLVGHGPMRSEFDVFQDKDGIKKAW